MRLFYKNRGAVSVFLVIILVPVLTVCALFVDASRIQLARSVAASSGELALNTVLSQFDETLEDYYGMMASVQNMDEFISVAKDYFKASMVSQGASDEEADYFSGLIQAAGSSGNVTDLLKIQTNDISITPVEGGNLSNPALVKKQIVEFMKYRSPINGAADLLESLLEVQKQSENTKDETEMLDRKQKFYEAENELKETALEIREQLEEYNNIGITEGMVQSVISGIDGYRNEYWKMHQKLVYDLFNTNGMSQFQRGTFNTNPTLSTVYSAQKKATADQMGSLIKDMAEAVRDYAEAKTALENAANTVPSENVYPVQYWVKMMEALNQGNYYNNYVRCVNDLCYAATALSNAYTYAEEGVSAGIYTLSVYDGVDTNGTKSVQEHITSLISQYNSIITGDVNSSGSMYNRLSKSLEDISKAAFGGASIELDGTISTSAVDQKVNGIRAEITANKDKIQEGYDTVTKSVSNLKKLKKLVEKYKSSFESWKEVANRSELDDSSLAVGDESMEGDRKEILTTEENQQIVENVTEENVDILVKRLEDIKSLLGTVLKSIDSCQYNGTLISKIDSYDKLKKASGLSADKIGMTSSELSIYAEESFDFKTEVSVQNITDNNNPDLTQNSPKLYSWIMVNIKPAEDEEEKKENEKLYDEYKEKSETDISDEEKSGQLGNDAPNISDLGDKLPSQGGRTNGADGTGLEKASEFIENLFASFSGVLSAENDNVLCSLYTTDYIMSMFSYDTIEKERIYDKMSESEQKQAEPSTMNVSAQSKGDAWIKENMLTLTNYILDNTNCYSYGNEVEYILYGGTNSHNKAAAYGNIFLLRFALNAVPVFQAYWTNDTVYMTAAAISAATGNIIPEALVRMVICLAILATESIMDLQYLRAGIGIKLVKGKNELFCTFDTVKSTEFGKGSNRPMGDGLGYFQYGDYLSLFLFLQLMGGNYEIYAKTADVIQVNVGKVTKNDGFLMKNAQVYYQLKADLEVPALMLTLPTISSAEGNRYQSITGWNQFSYQAVRGY